MADIKITYGDYAPEAKESFAVTSEDAAQFVDLTQLNRYNLGVTNYGNPCEWDMVPLDGSAALFPDDPDTLPIGFWSANVCGGDEDNREFATPPTINLRAQGQYSSQGFTLTFDTDNGIFPTSLEIVWKQNGAELDREQFTPDAAVYFCKKQVSNFDEVDIIFYSMNMPYSRLRLRSIDYGYGTEFSGGELRNVKLIQEIDPISSEISINTVDFTLDSHRDIVYSFQTRQPLAVYRNGELLATTFVRSYSRRAKHLWDVLSEDYIGIMADTVYYGGIYEKDGNGDLPLASAVLYDIFDKAKVPYELDSAFDAETVSGWIPMGTCRDALMQVAFKIGAVVDTSSSDIVRIFPLPNPVTPRHIPKDKIRQGQSFDDESTVTAVEVTAHSFTKGTETVEVFNAAETGAATDIFVSFSEPLYDLSIVNGTITESGANYAIIDADSTSCVLSGKKYDHTTRIVRKSNPNVLASELENVKAIENATLVSDDNADAVATRCYNWLSRVNSTSMKIIEGMTVQGGDFEVYDNGLVYDSGIKYDALTPETVTYDEPYQVGEKLTAETEYLGDVEGWLVSTTYNLNGNILVKDAVIK